ncbi:MAG: class I SAM-dependent methyltransferase [Candidatus ainarchaeum sp.]|nr:class I SAM-dependent methyltransferase [Candidatus ainarchaeum sp.]
MKKDILTRTARWNYARDASLFQKVETVPGEQALYETAKKEILAELDRLRRPITLIDFCCGTCEIFSRLIPEPRIAHFIGVDIEPAYLDFAKNRLAGVVGADLVRGDAVDCHLGASADVLLASSAYHHIEDDRKLPFLRNMIRHMKPDGRAIFAENVLPKYEDECGHATAAKLFYRKRIEEAQEIGMDENVLGLLHQVMRYEICREYEWKVDHRRFTEDLGRAGFVVLKKTKVWPTKFEFEDQLAGDYVILAEVPCEYM